MHTDKPRAAEIQESRERRRSLWKGPAATTGALLLIPLLGNHFIAGWNWPPPAFAVVGALLFAICFFYQLVTRNSQTIAYRVAVGIALATAFLLCWGNLVQWADVNRAAAMYFGVPIVMVIGAAIARLRPRGMARALLATALVQASALLTVLGLMLIREPHVTFWTPPELRGLAGNAVDLMLFIGAALLFRKAGRQELAARAA